MSRYYRQLIGSSVAYDIDALAFFTASGVTDTTQKDAVNNLVLGLKSNSLWTKMKALYPVVGGNASSHSYNLINTSLYQLTFSSGWTHSSTGMLPNGANAFARTGFSPNTLFSSKDSSGASYYSRTNRAKNYGVPFGCYDVTPNSFAFFSRTTSDTSLLRLNTINYQSTILTSVTNSSGFFTLNRISSSQESAFRNGANLITNNINSSGLPTAEMIIGANNPTTPIGSTVVNMEYYDNEEYSMFIFHDGITTPQIEALNTLVQAFQTSLSR